VVPVLKQMDPVPSFQPHFSEIHIIIMLPFTLENLQQYLVTCTLK